MRRAMATAWVALALGAPARADLPVVAVFDLEDRAKLAKDDVATLTEYIATRLAEGGRYRIVPKAEVQSALRQKKAESYATCYDESCQIEIGRELAAQKTLSSKVSRLGSTCLVTVQLYDLAQGASEGAGTARGGCNVEAVVALLDQALASLARDPAGVSAPSARASTPPPASAPPASAPPASAPRASAPAPAAPTRPGDRDGDRTLDRDDRCPDQPESPNGFEDADGCPDAVPGSLAAALGTLDVRYDAGRGRLSSTPQAALDRLASVLAQYPSVSIQLEVHTDSQGDDKRNLQLSSERAEAVRAYLVARGLSAARVSAQGFGESVPIAANDSAEGRQQNRRTVARLGTSQP